MLTSISPVDLNTTPTDKSSMIMHTLRSMTIGMDKLIHLSSVIVITGNITKILQIHLYSMSAVSEEISAKFYTYVGFQN
jgi:hypothetical protein